MQLFVHLSTLRKPDTANIGGDNRRTPMASVQASRPSSGFCPSMCVCGPNRHLLAVVRHPSPYVYVAVVPFFHFVVVCCLSLRSARRIGVHLQLRGVAFVLF